ncbi:hypothetical protein N7539_000070 [Penicillium diatomitis]|uniref:histone acetyltransferase n=1 Tax=Penicillium diatomitis TaxID=2819901 RepID=A0A9W9XL32_9EURO|nr:uncharacterized protein N7539_000070 [Penicillium diatomitis]KAJ5494954.1 hypothetical protein N7539_000070 [Penicillium diatomitis]
MPCLGELADLLASVLPASVELIVRHVSSTPAPSQDLFAAAPGHDPEPTFCENHFLSVSIESQQHEGAEIIIFGMEVLVFNTAHLTTIFVSKADSTGLLHLLDMKERVSVLRLITSTFLSFLVKSHLRPGVRLVVSLFARAQDQYLFPGSIDNAEKHVLDDRGLIKWWCRALDPIIREHGAESVSEGSQVKVSAEAAKASATAYLIVPGCDRFETRSFFPVSARSDPTNQPRWLASYPLQQLCRDPAAPPRCLVPRFPDDPKTRFLIDLDDELPESEDGEAPSSGSGHWKSVKSIDQFWELMAFRQECSAGRLVGFLWLVVNPPGLLNTTTMASRAGQGPSVSQDAKSKHVDDNGVSAENASLESDHGTHVAHGTKPPTNKAEDSAENSLDREVPHATTAVLPEKATLSSSTGKVPFHWPESGRGEVVLQEADYKKMMDGVLDQFYDFGEVAASTQFYIDQVASLADQLTWGKRITGTCSPQDASQKFEVANNLLSGDLLRKRKKPSQAKDEKDIDQAAVTEKQESKVASSTAEQPAAVNVLGAGLIRKKKKT